MNRLLLLLAILIAQVASAGTVLRQVGEVSLNVPAPTGFVNAAEVSDQLQRAAEAMTLRGNRTLLFLVSSSDAQRVRNGDRNAEFEQTLSAQVSLHSESQTIPLLYFANLKILLKQQTANALKTMRPEIQREFESAGVELGNRLKESSLKLQLGEVVPLGVFDERENSISFLTMTAFESSAKGKTESVTMATASTIIIIKNKIIYLYANVPFDSGSGVSKVKELTKAWVNELILVNIER